MAVEAVSRHETRLARNCFGSRVVLGFSLPMVEAPLDQKSIQRQVAATEKTIDALVYELYGLTEDEIRIVGGTA
jgi:hypothetical protein